MKWAGAYAAVVTPRSRPWRKAWLLGAILVAALGLRLIYVTQPYVDILSWRESSTAMIAEHYYREDWNIFYPSVRWTGPPPAYQGREFQTVSYLAAVLYLVVGQQDWVGRFVAAGFGVWGVFALWQLIQRVWDHERALVGAALMAILPGSVFIERSFLPDSAMVALVVTAAWLLLAFLETGHRHRLVLATVIGAWAVCSKLPGLIVGLPLAITILAHLRQPSVGHRTLSLQIAGAATLVLATSGAYYLWARHLALAHPPHHFAGEGNWLWDLGLGTWLENGYYLSAWRSATLLWPTPILAFTLLGLVRPVPRRAITTVAVAAQSAAPTSDTLPWFFHWWIVAGAVYYLIGARELYFNFWNFHLITPAIAALGAHAMVTSARWIVNLKRSASERSRVGVLATIFVGTALISGLEPNSLFRTMYRPIAQDDYELGLVLREVVPANDLIITIANDVGDGTSIYYSGRYGWSYPPLETATDQDFAWPPPDERRAIEMLDGLQLRGAQWLGVVKPGRKSRWDGQPLLRSYIDETYLLEYETPGWTIYQRRPTA